MSPATKERIATPATVAQAYFDALTRHDLDAACECWAPGGVGRIIGQAELVAPGGVRTYFGEVFAAFPDFALELLDATAQDERCAVRWRARATFAGPGSFQGIAPTGARVELEGCDVLVVRDGLIQSNDAYLDNATLARQLGLLPPVGSAGEQRLTAAFNTKTRLARRLAAGALEPVADGVWLLRGGFPLKTMNVYLIEHEGRVTLFDAGIRAMGKAIVTAAGGLGGIERVVLGHGHGDHRGAAPGLAVPVFCHPAERADAEGDGGAHYFEMGKLSSPLARFLMPHLLRSWDGGPVAIAGTLTEGDEVAGFSVIELPGHAPGLIGLWRATDRLALVSDCFYTLDPQTGRKGRPRVPLAAFNHDTEQARASIRKLAALEPAAAWPGHADPLTGDVRAALERGAEET